MERYPIKATVVAVALVAVAAVSLSALLTGCGPEKQLPDLPVAEGGGSAQPAQKGVPAKSDPEAVAVVEKAVKALTGGKPELLTKGKFCRYELKGTMDIGAGPTDTTQVGALAWPDRMHAVANTTANGGPMVVEAWVRRPDILVRGNGIDQRAGNPVEYERNFAADQTAQRWMPLLLPAADPKAVLFDPQTVAIDRRELKLVKLAFNDYPVCQLYFDGGSDALVRVEYTLTENGVPRRTAVAFAEHKPGPHGLVLPTRLETLHNKTTVERWAVEKWELPETIKDDEFVPKK